MNITQVTVSFKRVQSLPGYCNVSSGLTVTADLSADDDYLAVEQRLRGEAEQAINEWIDVELEQAGQPARYSTAPRYDLLFWRSAGLGVIIPTGWSPTDLKTLPGSWSFYHGPDDAIYTGQRLPNLRQMSKATGMYCPEFEAAVKLHGWAHYYLSTPNLWYIVKVYALDPTPDYDEERCLGRIAVPGEVYTELNADPALRIELETGCKSAGIAVPDSMAIGDPLVKTVDDAYLWIRSRIEKLHPDEADDEKDGYDF